MKYDRGAWGRYSSASGLDYIDRRADWNVSVKLFLKAYLKVQTRMLVKKAIQISRRGLTHGWHPRDVAAVTRVPRKTIRRLKPFKE